MTPVINQSHLHVKMSWALSVCLEDFSKSLKTFIYLKETPVKLMMRRKKMLRMDVSKTPLTFIPKFLGWGVNPT